MDEGNGNGHDIPPEPLVVIDGPSRLTKPKKLTGRQRAFIAAYVATGKKRSAAEAAKVSYYSHYTWLKEPAYAQAFKDACEVAGDMYEAEAIRRAYEGVEEPRFDNQGNETGSVRKFSDPLLAMLLKRFKPEYRERHIVTGPEGAPLPAPTISVNVHLDLSKLSDDELSMYRKLAERNAAPPLLASPPLNGNGHGNGNGNGHS